MNIPVIIITSGDPAGIGAEVTTKGLAGSSAGDDFIPIIIGHLSTYKKLRCYDDFRKLNLKYIKYSSIEGFKFDEPALLEPDEDIGEIKLGRESVSSGRAAGLYLDVATDILKNRAEGFLLTGPINKKYFREAGYNYFGHTDYLKSRTASEDVYMMFVRGDLKVLLATHHIPLRKVPEEITEEKIYNILKFIHKRGARYGLINPKIAVCGINPHAGENGLIGTEEERVLKPALTKAQKFGLNIEGPLPADALFRPEVREQYDLIIAMYHDQALTAVKTLGVSVNVTIGLPFIRVSVDHGTAYDIARKSVADEGSFREALKTGIELYRLSKKKRI